MFPSFGTWETLFPSTENTVSVLRQKNYCFPCDKTGKHRRKTCSQQMFLATCFLVLAGLKKSLSALKYQLFNWNHLEHYINSELSSNWPEMTAFHAAFKYFCGPPRKKRKTSRGKRWTSIYFIFAFHFVTVVVMTGFRTLRIIIFTKFSSWKIAAIQ